MLPSSHWACSHYTMRQDKLLIAGHFSVKLRTYKRSWLPCELKALAITAATKHFSPYIIQSQVQSCVLTDNEPCIEAVEKLCRGEVSASPRATTFLSTISMYQVSVRHLPSTSNFASDFGIWNASPALKTTTMSVLRQGSTGGNCLPDSHWWHTEWNHTLILFKQNNPAQSPGRVSCLAKDSCPPQTGNDKVTKIGDVKQAATFANDGYW